MSKKTKDRNAEIDLLSEQELEHVAAGQGHVRFIQKTPKVGGTRYIAQDFEAEMKSAADSTARDG